MMSFFEAFVILSNMQSKPALINSFENKFVQIKTTGNFKLL